MKSRVLCKLKEMGNKTDDYIERFEGDEATCEMLVAMFAQDNQYMKYVNAYKAGDYEACKEHIHGLKGAAANVGLTCLSEKAIIILTVLKSGSLDGIESLNEELNIIYTDTMDALNG